LKVFWKFEIRLCGAAPFLKKRFQEKLLAILKPDITVYNCLFDEDIS